MTTQQSTRTVERFMADPIECFGGSLTQMHTIPRKELEELQRRRWRIRFADTGEHRDRCARPPTGSASRELRDFDDVVPLMFSHAAFKSYPAALLDRKRYDLMTEWLDKLTSHDLSQRRRRAAATTSTSGSRRSTSRRRSRSSPRRARPARCRSSRRTGPGPRSRWRSWLVMYCSRPSARSPRRASSSPRST